MVTAMSFLFNTVHADLPDFAYNYISPVYVVGQSHGTSHRIFRCLESEVIWSIILGIAHDVGTSKLLLIPKLAILSLNQACMF